MMECGFDFNQLSQIEPPQIILCKRNKQKLGQLYPIEDLRIAIKMNDISECSFTVYKKVNGRLNPLWEQLNDLKLICIPQFGYFELYINKSSNITDCKKITARSLEAELGQIYLNDFQVNDTSDDTFEDYEITKFHNPTDAKHSLLHRILEKTPSWKIGHVDDSLWNMQRTFSIDNTAIYDFLTGEVSEQFQCLFEFDTFNKQIDVYALDTYGYDTVLYLNRENYIQEFGAEADAGAIKNCFKVVGGEGIDVREVNPNGTDYIWNFSEETKADMRPELVQKLKDYDTLYTQSIPSYTQIMEEIQAKTDVILELQNREPTNSNDVTNWTKYGLIHLKSKLNAYQALEDNMKASGMSETTHISYNTIYLPNHNAIQNIEANITIRTTEIEHATKQYNDSIARRNALQKSLDLESYLGTNLWLELSLYRREDKYENNNYSTTDITTDNERIEMEKALLSVAKEELLKACRPQYKANVSMSNLLASQNLIKQNIGAFRVGNFIRIDDGDNISKLRLVSIEIDFNKLEDIQVEFSDMITANGCVSDIKSILDQATSAATSYQTIMQQYDANKNNMSFVDNLRKDGLSSMLSESQNATNQDFTIGSRGIIGREWNDEKQAYENEQIHILKNQIIFTDDNWKSARAGFGKMKIGTSSYYGLISDVLIGKLMVSEKLHIENKEGSFVVDENGVTITKLNLNVTNGKNTLKIATNSNEIFQILKGNDKVLYLDTDGSAHFKGDITGANGTFSGLVSGGTIDIGGAFKVNSNGEMTASKGTFSGVLNATSGNIGGIGISPYGLVGGRITGCEITSFDSSNASQTRISGGIIECNNIILAQNQGKQNACIRPDFMAVVSDTNGSTVINGGMIHTTSLYAASLYPTRVFGSSPGTAGTYVYSFWGDNGNDGVPSAAWVKKYVENQGSGISKVTINKLDRLITLPDGYQFLSNTYANTIVNARIDPITNTLILDQDVRCTFSGKATSTAADAACSVNGNVAYVAASSKRYKEEICDVINPDLDVTKLYQLKLRQYKYKPNYLSEEDQRYDATFIGFIAEELNEIFPIAVDKNRDGSIEVWNPNIMIPALFGLIKDLHKRETENNNQLQLLEKRLQSIEQKETIYGRK